MAVFLQLLVLGAVTGLVAIILGAVLGFKVLPDNMDENLQKNVRLELSETYRDWETLPYNITTKYVFFDVKNAAKVMEGQVATFVEKGALVYNQRRYKEDIVYDSSEDTFSYSERVTNDYNRASDFLETESIVTLNVLKYLSLNYANEDGLMDRVKDDLEYVFPDTENNNLFHRINVRDLLFDGYESCHTENIPSQAIGAKLLRSLIILKLGQNKRFKKMETGSGYLFYLFKQDQNYVENNYEMYGGVQEISRQGYLKAINGDGNLTFWPELDENNYCNRIRGTDSFTFPPNIDVDNGISMFNNDLCRSVDYAFTEELGVQDLTAHRLILKSENFAPIENVPDNVCFCIEDSIENNCSAPGTVNLANCYDGIPMIASLPHFLYAEEKYAEPFKFLPSVEKDVSFVDIQVESGVLLRRTKRTQYNMWVQKIPGFAEDINPFLLPLFWVEETMEIPENSVTRLNEVYFDDLVMVEGVKWGLLGCGVALLLLCSIIFIVRKLKFSSKS